MCDSSYCAICAFAHQQSTHTRIEKREREKTNHDESIQSDNCIRNRADHTHRTHNTCRVFACVNMQESTRAKIKINERQFVDRDGAGFVRRFNFCCFVCLFLSLSWNFISIIRAKFHFTVQSYFVNDKSVNIPDLEIFKLKKVYMN